MADIALYRKYRPVKFADLVGQEPIRTTLQNAVKQNALSHAYLFCGTRGTGKTSTARLVARVVNCENVDKNGEPCGKCSMCKDIEDGRLIDLIEIDAASNRGIDEIRDLKEKLHFAPTRGKAKIYIIDEVHMLTKEAFNALLKTLEEPPSHSYFILATTEVHKIPETIISRCQRFDFKRIGERELIDRLKYIAKQEKFEIEEEALKAIVKHVNGGMRDAIGLIEQLSGDGKIDLDSVQRILGVTGDKTLEELYECLCSEDGVKALQIVDNLFVQGQDFAVFVKNFLWFLRGKMIEAVKNNDTSLSHKVLSIIEMIHKVSEQLGSAPIPQLPLEAVIVKLCGSSVKNHTSSFPAAESKKENLTAPVETTSKAETSRPTDESSESVDQNNDKSSGDNVQDSNQPEVAKNSVLPSSLSAEQLQSKWKEVLAKISTPSLRMSAQQGKITELKGNELVLEFNSKFHFERVNHASDLTSIEKAFLDVTQATLKVSTVFKEPAITDDHSADRADELIEKAEELFS